MAVVNLSCSCAARIGGIRDSRKKNALSIFRKSTENWQRAQAIFASLAKWILSCKEQVLFADEAKTFVVSVSSKSSLIFAGVLPLQIDIGFSLALVFT